jgi:hypothetical protein
MTNTSLSPFCCWRPCSCWRHCIAKVPSYLCPATSVIIPVLTFFRGNLLLLVSCSSYQSQCCFTTSTFCRCLHSRFCWCPFGYKGILLLSFLLLMTLLLMAGLLLLPGLLILVGLLLPRSYCIPADTPVGELALKAS